MLLVRRMTAAHAPCQHRLCSHQQLDQRLRRGPLLLLLAWRQVLLLLLVRRQVLLLLLPAGRQVLAACTGGTMRMCWSCRPPRRCTCRAS